MGEQCPWALYLDAQLSVIKYSSALAIWTLSKGRLLEQIQTFSKQCLITFGLLTSSLHISHFIFKLSISHDWIHHLFSGLLRLSSTPIGLVYDSNFSSGTREEVVATYRATCCAPRVLVTAVDSYGNVNSYVVDISSKWQRSSIWVLIWTSLVNKQDSRKRAKATSFQFMWVHHFLYIYIYFV